MINECPICRLSKDSVTITHQNMLVFFSCPRCGQFRMPFNTQDQEWAKSNQLSDRQRAVLSYAVRHSASTHEWDNDKLQEVLDRDFLPTVPEQVDILIEICGDQQKSIVNQATLQTDQILSQLGVICEGDIRHLLNLLADEAYFEKTEQLHHPPGETYARLTYKGWERYAQIKKGKSKGRRGFMAMPFKYPVLDENLQNHWRPASDATGFQLMKLDDEPEAGSITNRMKVQIKKSKFVVAELTHSNSNVYWEAGYAEGLSKPVIYLCEKNYFKDPEKGVGFDVGQLQCILWDRETMDSAAEQLKATIRYTFPDDAKMED